MREKQKFMSDQAKKMAKKRPIIETLIGISFFWAVPDPIITTSSETKFEDFKITIIAIRLPIII